MRQIVSGQEGFTIIEALVAIAILTVGITALYTMQFTSVNVNSTANTVTRASSDASNIVEDFFASKFDAALLSDVDGDGTGQDNEANAIGPDGNGIDDNGGNFGLDDFQCCQDGKDAFGNVVAGCTAKADGCSARSDGYAVYWNVAVDEPMMNTKRILVQVVNSARGDKGVEFEYIVGLDMQGTTPTP